MPPEGMEHLFAVYGGACIYCGAPADTIDHLDPVSRGGRTTPGNVAPACKSCNSRKRDTPFEEWLDLLEKQPGGLSEGVMRALEFRDCSLWG